MDSPAAEWPVLTTLERHILGTLVEKAKTRPESYPLTLNALQGGVNQKSNRDPILNVEEDQIEDALDKLKSRGLVMLVQSTRVDRWRHLLYEVWTPDKIELAVLAELLLRGPQTEGELRTRVSRMEPVESLEDLREVLEPLVRRKLVVYLTPPRSRGAMLTHAFHAPHELERARTQIGSQPPVEEPPTERAASAPPAAAVRNEELLALQAEVSTLRHDVQQLRGELDELKRQLGVG